MDEIHIGSGIIHKISRLIVVRQQGSIALITDQAVEKLLRAKIAKILPEKLVKIVLPKGEQTKNIETVQRIWQKLLENGCDRQTLVINLGGGVISDVGGFAASTYMRGINFINVPTTLLAQVDASVGGKTGINFAGVKNLIGIFNQPLAIFCDINFLSTLPDREFTEGFTEAIKHGIIADKAYFDFVTAKKPKDFNKKELEEIVVGSVNIKAGIVKGDEKDAGKRKILNFGHTIGHAVEALSQETDKPLLHGEAISIGMAIEAKISQLLGLISKEEVNRIKKALDNAGLPLQMPDFPTEAILTKIKSDKKSEEGKINWTLVTGIGKAIINQQVDNQILKKALI
ncbi:3-dehydroquinate synthase [Candidatus Daviesbacteria bacterium]|nr:3-dehydroquinate synthase [Candidatus Daviesbacteria bacterium]